MTWVPGLDLGLSLVIDGRATALLLLVAVVATATLTWTALAREQRWRSTLALLAVFVVAVSALLVAGDVITYVLAWEATSILSYVLVGLNHETPAARRAARTTLVVTGLGGVVLLIGLLVLASVAGGTSFAELASADLTSSTGAIGAFLVLVGAMTKSAQVPFHGWLLGASTAPSPASALLHAAALVIAGVDALLRIAPAASAVPGWSGVAVGVGLSTLTWCSWVAVRAKKAKVVLAGTTAAQMGLAFALAGLGQPKAATAAIAVLLVHGLYKSGLFLLAGDAKRRTGDAGLTGIHALADKDRLARVVLWGGAMLLAGAPPLAGWISKEAAVAELLGAGPMTAALLVPGTALGVWVAARLVGLDRAGRAAKSGSARVVQPGPTVGQRSLLMPAALVTVAVLLMVPGVLAALVSGAAEEVTKLVIWPGFGQPLAVSVAGLLLGGVLVAAFTAPAASRDAAESLASGLDGMLRGARHVRVAVHRMDRPAVVAAVAGPSVLLLLPLSLPAIGDVTNVPFATSPTQAIVAAILLLGIAGAMRLRSRTGAVISLGVVGYALAGLFAVHGAPDLVLTQAIVETVVVVVFVAVLRRLPETADTHPAKVGISAGERMRGGVRTLIALGGGAVAAATAFAVTSPQAPRGLVALAESEALPTGAGRNIVNVVLTDFRALDTVGELSVLLLAALGVIGMSTRRRTTAAEDDVRSSPPVGTWADSHLLVGAAPVLARLAIVIGLHLLAIGHDQPGGGFAGGLVVAAGLALHQVATGELPANRLFQRPQMLMGAGMLVVTAVMVAPLLVGGVAGDMGSVTLNLGPIGSPKLTSALVLDIGVLLIVVGMVLAAMRLQTAPRVLAAEEGAR